MSANVLAVMAAMEPQTTISFSSDADAPALQNPYRAAQHIITTSSGIEWFSYWGSGGDYSSEYAHDLVGLLEGIKHELYFLGVTDAGDMPVHFPAESENWVDFVTDDQQENKNSLYQYMVLESGTNSIYNSTDTDSDNTLTLPKLYDLANTYARLYHNVVSFLAYTDILSGQWLTPEEQFYNGKSSETTPYEDHITLAHPAMSNTISHTTQFASLAVHHENANGATDTAEKMFMTINTTTVATVRSTLHVFDYLDHGASNPRMNDTNGPLLNACAMWVWTSNGTAAVVGASAARPPGLSIDQVDGAHVSAGMSPDSVYQAFRDQANNMTYYLRGMIDDSLAAGDIIHTPGIPAVNTFFYDTLSWVERYTKAQALVDLINRGAIPSGQSSLLQAAIANTA